MTTATTLACMVDLLLHHQDAFAPSSSRGRAAETTTYTRRSSTNASHTAPHPSPGATRSATIDSAEHGGARNTDRPHIGEVNLDQRRMTTRTNSAERFLDASLIRRMRGSLRRRDQAAPRRQLSVLAARPSSSSTLLGWQVRRHRCDRDRQVRRDRAALHRGRVRSTAFSGMGERGQRAFVDLGHPRWPEQATPSSPTAAAASTITHGIDITDETNLLAASPGSASSCSALVGWSAARRCPGAASDIRRTRHLEEASRDLSVVPASTGSQRCGRNPCGRVKALDGPLAGRIEFARISRLRRDEGRAPCGRRWRLRFRSAVAESGIVSSRRLDRVRDDSDVETHLALEVRCSPEQTADGVCALRQCRARTRRARLHPRRIGAGYAEGDPRGGGPSSATMRTDGDHGRFAQRDRHGADRQRWSLSEPLAVASREQSQTLPLALIHHPCASRSAMMGREDCSGGRDSAEEATTTQVHGPCTVDEPSLAGAMADEARERGSSSTDSRLRRIRLISAISRR